MTHFLAGQKLTASLLEEIINPKRAKVTLSASQTISHNTLTPIDWPGPDYDEGTHYNASFPDRLEVVEAGLYVATFWFRMEFDIYDRLFGTIIKNLSGGGTETVARADVRTSSAQESGHSMGGEIEMAVGDYFTFEVLLNNDSDTSGDISGAAATIRRVSDLAP